MRTTKTTLALLALTATACSTATMKAPAGVASSQALVVKGYSGNVQTFKEQQITIGSYAVTNVDRDWDKGSGMSAGLWSRDSKKKAYRFDVEAQGRKAHGECTEQAVEHSIGGFGKAKVTFGCVCTEGATERAKLELVNGQGTATLSGGASTYDLAVVHESEQGAQVGSALGYHFRSAQGEGAVDVTGNGRAWVPASASEDDLLGLVCGYAGLLLYRPTE